MYYSKQIMIAAAAVPLCTAITAGGFAYAAEAPTDIHLTVQTKEIDIEDIPADRVVTLDIYQENCPAFYSLMFFVNKDPRLSYYPEYDCFRLADGVRNAGQPDIGYYDPEPDYRRCDICMYAGEEAFVEFDNAIATLTLKLPDQVSPGDFFAVDLLRKHMDTSVQINLGRKRADMFTEEAFAQLNGGGILITQREQPAPAPDGSGGGQSAGDSIGGGQGGGEAQSPADVPQPGDNNTPIEAAPASTTASTVVTAAVTAVTTNTTTTSAVQSTSTTSEKTTTESTTVTSSQSSATEIATGAPEENEKKNKGGFFTIALITFIVVAVASTALLAEKLRMNRK